MSTERRPTTTSATRTDGAENADAPQGAGAPAEPAAPTRPRTRWGDRSQRRIDILDAAREHISRQGYRTLNMRDLAAAARVSPATLYSYFANKEELFATLYAEALRNHTEAIEPLCGGELSAEELLVELMQRYIGLYNAYGQHFTMWSELRESDAAGSPFPVALIRELRAASKDYGRTVRRGMATAIEREGRRLIESDVATPFLWSTMNGLADHFTSDRRTLDTCSADDLLHFSAQRLLIALTEPA
ncbi:MAG: helix-turn-helix domain-containing protein [Actinomycetota bacterium]|nr:helix-turn-helix domain-containing protein [Actinomycetota bacterium]